MKYVAWIVCVVAGPALAWGAATDEFKFVSTLSAPVASFGTVETKSCVVTQPEDEFNVGNAEAACSPTSSNPDPCPINIQGGRMEVDELYMEGNTTLGSSSNINWLVRSLYVGDSGGTTVQVNKLIAKQVNLHNSSSAADTTLNVNNILQVDSHTYATKVEATNTFTVKQCSNGTNGAGCFRFSGSTSEPAVSITWGQIAAQEYGAAGAKQTETLTTAMTKSYPISTEFLQP